MTQRSVRATHGYCVLCLTHARLTRQHNTTQQYYRSRGCITASPATLGQQRRGGPVRDTSRLHTGFEAETFSGQRYPGSGRAWIRLIFLHSTATYSTPAMLAAAAAACRRWRSVGIYKSWRATGEAPRLFSVHPRNVNKTLPRTSLINSSIPRRRDTRGTEQRGHTQPLAVTLSLFLPRRYFIHKKSAAAAGQCTRQAANHLAGRAGRREGRVRRGERVSSQAT